MAPKKPRTVPSSTPTTAKPKDRKRTGPPKKELSDEEKCTKLYATLVKQLDGAHFANALKTTDKRTLPSSLTKMTSSTNIIL